MLLGQCGVALRKCAKRILIASAILLAVLFCGSAFFCVSYTKGGHLPDWTFAVSEGQFHCGWIDQETDAVQVLAIEPHPRSVRWDLPSLHSNGGSTEFFCPLWIPLLILVMPLACIWYAHMRRPLPGQCTRCRYDLRGNTSGRCPECGKPIPFTSPVPKPRASHRMRRLRWNTCCLAAMIFLWVCASFFQMDYKFLTLLPQESIGGWLDPYYSCVSLERGCLRARISQLGDAANHDLVFDKWQTLSCRKSTFEMGLEMPAVAIEESDSKDQFGLFYVVLPLWPVVFLLIVSAFGPLPAYIAQRAGRLRYAATQSATS